VTLEQALLAFFPQGNPENEFPRNLDVLHDNLRKWFSTNVRTVNGNPIILSVMVDSYLSVLKGAIRTSMSDTIWRDYLGSFVTTATFNPLFPPIGLILPSYGLITVQNPVSFPHSMSLLDNLSKVPMFAALMKSWIMQQRALEYWSRIGESGVVPVPPIAVPLVVVS